MDQRSPHQASQPLSVFPPVVQQPFVLRFAVAAAAAFGVVFVCALSLQIRAQAVPHLNLSMPALGVALAAVPAGLIAAALVRRSPVLLILTSQVLTIGLLAASFWVGA